MLESHYFFKPERDFARGLVKRGQWGMGPFVAIQPGTDEIIEAFALGWMWGFKRVENPAIPDNSSWNIGVGAVVDPNVRILGAGFDRNMPPPGSETQVRFREKAQLGVLVLVSFSF